MKNWLLLVIFVCAVVLPMLMLGGKSHRLFLVQLTRHCRRRIFIKVSWRRELAAAGDLDGRRRRTNIWDLWAQSFEDSAVMYVLHGRRPWSGHPTTLNGVDDHQDGAPRRYVTLRLMPLD